MIKSGIYRHYKGKKYRVIHTATHTETGEVVVVYQSLYGNYDFWIRPLSMFLEKVVYKGQEMSRFTLEQELLPI